MRAPVHMYVYAYADRAVYEKWETQRATLATMSDAELRNPDFLPALIEMVDVLHGFCDVLKEVCLRALKVYGRRKAFAFGSTID